ncbi:hypothetical protein [Roseobacter sp. HKCCA0434]|uniref:hypothetical protein n=1 Tax=Roseobacter sp. HKCCA0434 TaxID=3079297 RepID=UPI002905DAE7|nr:hypothetical protein [Roseobacter sp. HKCCA0434]
MTDYDDSQSGGANWRISCARTVYKQLGMALEGRLRQLGETEPASADDGLAKKIAEEIRLHQKSLIQLLEYEATLDDRNASSASGGPDIDFDAARDELRARILAVRKRG